MTAPLAEDYAPRRRTVLVGLVALVGLAAAGTALIEAPRLFRRRYKPTPYDDLLSRLDDRDAAERLGSAYRAGHSRFQLEASARQLRTRLGREPLADALHSDLTAGRLGVVHGWVLPETLLLLCGLAAN